MGCGTSKSVIVESHKLPKQKSPNQPILFIWPGSAPCRAVYMTARAISVPVQIHRLNIFNDDHKTEEFQKINPKCTIPFLVDGDNKMWNSHEIMKHLVNHYTKGNKIYPGDPNIREEVDKYLYYDEEEVFPAISNWIHPQVFEETEPDSSKKVLVEDRLETINDILKKRSYIATNHVTLADLSITSSLSLLELKDWDFTKWSHIQKWRNQLKRLPYYAECNIGLEDWKFYLHVRDMKKNEE